MLQNLLENAREQCRRSLCPPVRIAAVDISVREIRVTVLRLFFQMVDNE